MVRPVTLAAIAALLGGCTQTAVRPSSDAVGPASVPFAMPSGTGCSGDIARFRAVLENDVATGNAARSVLDRATPDLTRAEGACAAGRSGEATAQLAATKARFGYR